MKTISKFILIAIAVLAFTGCGEDLLTSHPDEGGVVLTTNWSDVKTPPAALQVRVISLSGSIRDFDNLQDATNSLVVEPGNAVIYVFNKADNITFSENRAKVTESNYGGISPEPGIFYSCSEKVTTERDRDISLTATMKQRTGDLKLSLAIMPAEMIDRVRQVKVVVEGVSSELNMQTNELSATSFIPVTLTKSSYYASTSLRLFGFDTSARQNLKLEIELDNGTVLNATNDVTQYLAGFNDVKGTQQSLSGVLHVSESAVTVDNWKRNTADSYLSVSPLEITLQSGASEGSASITTDQILWTFSIVDAGDWLTVTKTENRLTVHATENTKQEQRKATVNISTGGGLTESVDVTQEAAQPETHGYYSDKKVVKLQSATVGKGIPLVLMGDGYTEQYMEAGTGKYETDMRAAVDHFFSVYPLSEYRNYFNIYMVAAISNEDGISIKSSNTYVDTKFETLWEGAPSTGIDCNVTIVLEYMDAISELDGVNIHDITVLLPINAYIYAGTCKMYASSNNNDPYFLQGFADGFSICLCPVGNSFKPIVVHEGAGHGFSKLDDEYVYNPKEQIPASEKNVLLNLKRFGWCENVDFYPTILQTTWSGFANNPKYNMVGMFEGASAYGKGIWRPEQNSCMNDNTLYFNAPSRWAQVRRVMHLTGFNYSFAQFLQDDVVPEYPAQTRSSVEKFVPLAPPVVKTMPNWKIGEKRK